MSETEGGPADRVGLCARCAHAQRVTTPRSTFWLCRLSATDPRFERYPRLPVLRCTGFTPGDPGTPGTSD